MWRLRTDAAAYMDHTCLCQKLSIIAIRMSDGSTDLIMPEETLCAVKLQIQKGTFVC